MDKLCFLDGIKKEGEEWKFLPDTEDYAVSSLGRVVSFVKKAPQLLKLVIQETRGRKYVHVCIHSKKVRVHRLVAKAFLPKPNGASEIDHINNDGTDNRACNLMWCTHKENMGNPITKKNKEIYYPRSESLRNELGVTVRVFGSDNKDKAKRIAQYKDGTLIRVYDSMGEAEKCGFLKTSVSAALHGRLKTYRGYTWIEVHDVEQP